MLGLTSNITRATALSYLERILPDPMTTLRTPTSNKKVLASRAKRTALVRDARKRLPDLVYRTMHMEGERISRRDAVTAVGKVLPHR
jgi:hypothetical protein